MSAPSDISRAEKPHVDTIEDGFEKTPVEDRVELTEEDVSRLLLETERRVS